MTRAYTTCEHTDRYADGHCKKCTRRRRTKSDYDKRYNRKWNKTLRGRILRMLCSARSRSKEKGLPDPTITSDWIEAKMRAGVCELTGIPFALTEAAGPCLPSVDRIDVTKGYTEDNCRVILWALNAAFATWGEEQFAEIAKTWLSARELLG